MATPDGPQRVKLEDLSIQQLAEVKETFEQDLKIAQAQYEALQAGRVRFNIARETMKKLHETPQEQAEILIPMTQSVYQFGTLTNKGRFTVDIGAGYYVERSYEKNREYLDKRIKQLDIKLEQILKALGERRKAVELVTLRLQGKIAAN